MKSEDEDGTEDDYSYVKDTLTALTRVVELINKNKREKENKDKLRSIEESIDGFNLKVGGSYKELAMVGLMGTCTIGTPRYGASNFC